MFQPSVVAIISEL